MIQHLTDAHPRANDANRYLFFLIDRNVWNKRQIDVIPYLRIVENILRSLFFEYSYKRRSAFKFSNNKICSKFFFNLKFE